jgi:hypothetical protein
VSYIVRIYRCGPSVGTGHRAHDAIELIGTVEDAHGQQRRSFQNIEDLWALLATASPKDNKA